MTAKTMAEVLAAHWSVSTHADNEPEPPVDKCDGCGKVLHTWGDQIPEVHPLAAHQAAVLSAAGFGLVADAKAEAWDRGFASGKSRAMRAMSDEPSLPLTAPNPYRDPS
jgi:hypothetical protein